MEFIPEEILEGILQYVSELKHMIPICRLVCSTWYYVVSKERVDACAHAVHHGDIKLLKWIYYNGGKLTNAVLYKAISCGSLEILKWLDSEVGIVKSNYPSADTDAAYAGRLEVLQWLESKFYPISPSIIKASLQGGHSHIFRWAYDKRFPMDEYDYEGINNLATTNGDVETIKWLSQINMLDKTVIAEYMVMSGHADKLPQVLNLIEPDCSSTDYAAEIGDLKLLQYLRSIDLPWDWTVLALAAERGYLDMLQWAYDNGCPVGDHGEKARLCDYAAEAGRLDTLQWAYEHGFPCNGKTYRIAINMNHTEVAKWILDNVQI